MATELLGGGPELLTDGPRQRTRRARVFAVVGAFVLVVLIGGGLVWRLRPPPPPLFTRASLEGVYEGMVRSDGSSEASPIVVALVQPEVGTVDPDACTPLFETTVLNRPPQGALDGVGTFWELYGSAVSLFTYRYADREAPAAELERLRAAVDECSHARVRIAGGLPISGDLTVVPSVGSGPPRDAVAYVVTSDDGIKVAIHVFALSNAVSWQYRYESTPGAYRSLAAQRFMDSLADQMESVLALSATAPR